MRILLTGVTGFIGRSLVPLLADHEIVGLVRPGRTVPQVATVVADLTRPLDPSALPSRIDAVIHLAQSPRPCALPEGAAEAFAVHVAATAQLLDWAAKSGARHFCLISTGSVYEPYDRPLEEAAPVNPRSFYAASKLAAEVILNAYESILSVAALRLFFPYGSGQVGRLVANLAERIARGQPIELPPSSDGLTVTPTWVGDVAAIIAASTNLSWRGTYNVAAPEAVTLRQLGEEIARVIGRAATFVEVEGTSNARILPETRRLGKVWDIARFTPLRAGLERSFRA
jgi:UDP-glucose 4-epimerase